MTRAPLRRGPEGPEGRRSELWAFWQAFVGSPRHVGALAPSSRALAEEMLREIDWERARTVVECGPGSGAFTGTIRERLRPDARFLAVELHPGFAAGLRERFPGLDVHQGSAADLPAVLRRLGLGTADAVISSLPWASFPPEEQRVTMDGIAAALAPGGRLATFAYLGGTLLAGGRRARARLRERFTEVRRGPVVWANVPPAFVYHCRR